MGTRQLELLPRADCRYCGAACTSPRQRDVGACWRHLWLVDCDPELTTARGSPRELAAIGLPLRHRY